MQALLDLFQPGRTIYIPGATGESFALAEALAAEPDRMRDVHLVSCLLPGVNGIDYMASHPTARMTTFMLPEACRTAFDAGRVRLLPLPYTSIAHYLSSRLEIDVAIAHVAPPDADGLCSLGIAADFTPLAWRRAKNRALIVNQSMPAMKRGPRFALADADVTVSVDVPVVTLPTNRSDPILDSIGARVASQVPNGAAVEFGLGGAPGAVWRHLSNHRDLVIASGLVAEELVGLAKAGALRAGGQHRAGIAVGSRDLHRFLAEEDIVAFASVPETHGTDSLVKLDRFTAINSAIEIDLFGQANLEWQNGRIVSGVGGAPDFARGAAASPGGRSIIALPSTAKKGSVSRITARLHAPTVSLSRGDVDIVVTEHGIAELRDRSLDERAEALIAIAAPEWREPLAERWHALRQTL
jgi:acyl-CoA hydrolase